MKALLFQPGEAVELIDTDDFEETLGREADYVWPFKDPEICLVVCADRDDLEPNRTFEECGLVRGPFLAVGCHDDFDDLTEEQASTVEAGAAFADPEYPEESCDPFEEDAQEEEDWGGVRIVDELEGGGRQEHTEIQR